MARYEKSCREIMSEWLRQKLKPGDMITWEEIRRYMQQNYPKLKRNTVECHVVLFATNVLARRSQNPKPGRDDILFRLKNRTLRLYNPDTDPPPIYAGYGLDSDNTLSSEDEEDVQVQEMPELRYESDLRDFLATNLDRIESGLRLYRSGSRKGAEFPVEEGRIDLLATDSQGGFVVIELKAVAGRPGALGQILYYMSWVGENLAGDKPVRGFIIARDISEKLKMAARKVPDVTLFTYELQVSVNKIG